MSRFRWSAQSAWLVLVQNQKVFMRIAIIGAGSVGATVGRAWIKHGEDVIWGSTQSRRSETCGATQGARQSASRSHQTG